MNCKLTWTNRAGAPRSEDHIFNAYEDAVREVALVLPQVNQGDMLELVADGQVLLSLRCEKAPIRSGADTAGAHD